MVLVVDDDEKVLNFLEALQSGDVDAANYGEIRQVPEDVWESILQRYNVSYV